MTVQETLLPGVGLGRPRGSRSGPASRSGPDAADAAPAASVPGHLSIWVKLYLLAVILPVAFYAGPIYMTGLRSFLLVLVLPLLFGLVSGRYGRLNLLDITFIAHLIWMLASFAVTTPQAVVGVQGAITVEALGGYLLARAYIRDRATFMALCRFVGLLAMLMLPLALYEARTGDPIVVRIIRSLPSLTSVEIVTIEQRLGLHRVQAVFAHPIHFGLFCSVAFSLTFVGLKDVLGIKRRYISSAIIAFCTFLALSSGALLALMLQLCLIAWFTMLRNVQARWWILFGLFVLMYIVIDLLSTRSPIRVFMSYATFSPGTAYWRGLIFEWGIKNVFGDAANNIPSAMTFGIGMADWVRPEWMGTASVDNFWLLTAMRHGMPAFVLLAVGYVWLMVKVGLRGDMNADTQFMNLRRAWMFTFVGLTFTLSTVYIWGSVYSFVNFMLAAGIWMLVEQPRLAGAKADKAADPTPEAAFSAYSRFPIAPRPEPRQ